MDYVLGIDFGTSGCRATVVASDASIIYETKQTYPGSESDGWSRRWKDALQSTFHTIPGDIMARIGRICFDGTSATTLLIDMKSGDVISDAKLYNESQSEAAVSHGMSVLSSPPPRLLNMALL